ARRAGTAPRMENQPGSQRLLSAIEKRGFRAAELAHLLGRLSGHALQPPELDHPGEREISRREMDVSIWRNRRRNGAPGRRRADVRERPRQQRGGPGCADGAADLAVYTAARAE